MTDLIAELAEVDRLSEKATPGPWLYRAKSNSWYGPPPEGSRYSYGDFIMGMGDDAEGTNDWDEPFLIAAVQFVRTHIDGIRALARDAERLRNAASSLISDAEEYETADGLLFGVQPHLLHALQDAMHDSAREGSNG